MSDTAGESSPQELTRGQKAVGLSFNPSSDQRVYKVKVQFGTIIDHLMDLRDATDNPEKKRMYSVAITEAQTAQMWAVKAITWEQ